MYWDFFVAGGQQTIKISDQSVPYDFEAWATRLFLATWRMAVQWSLSFAHSSTHWCILEICSVHQILICHPKIRRRMGTNKIEKYRKSIYDSATIFSSFSHLGETILWVIFYTIKVRHKFYTSNQSLLSKDFKKKLKIEIWSCRYTPIAN